MAQKLLQYSMVSEQDNLSCMFLLFRPRHNPTFYIQEHTNIVCCIWQTEIYIGMGTVVLWCGQYILYQNIFKEFYGEEK